MYFLLLKRNKKHNNLFLADRVKLLEEKGYNFGPKKFSRPMKQSFTTGKNAVTEIGKNTIFVNLYLYLLIRLFMHY